MLPVEQKLSDFLKRYEGLKLAILFGSMAQGTETPQSDLDLAVMFDRAMTPEQRSQMIEELALEFGRPVDLVDLRTAGEPLCGQIFKGKQVFGERSAWASRLTQHLLDVEDFLPLRNRILKERRERWIKG